MKVLKTYKPKLTQGYSSSHTGNDIVGSNNGKSVLDTIVAIVDGKVTQVINTCNVNTNGKDGHKLDKSNPGNLVKIEHANGYVTRYLHMGYKSIPVKVGQKVKAGAKIGVMANTGYSFGGHLHLDMWLNGKKIDPYDYVFKDKTFDSKPNVVYQVRDYKTKKYLPNVKNGNDYAGVIGHTIDGLKVKLSNGDKIYYQVHIKNGAWLPVVSKWDDTSNGYAGIYGKEIDGVAIKSDKYTIKYRVHLLNGGWLAWVKKMDIKDSVNGMAGILGKTIDAIQIDIV